MATTRLLPLKQVRSKETRAKLVAAANSLWREHGYEGATVRDICADAGVAVGAFYRHFETKEDLLVELGLATAERLDVDRRRGRAADSLEDQVVRSMRGLARRVERGPRDLVRHTIQHLYSTVDRWQNVRSDRQDLHAVIASLIVDAQDRGEVPPAIVPDEVAAVLAASVMQAVLAWSQERLNGKLADVLERRTRIVLRGAIAFAGG